MKIIRLLAAFFLVGASCLGAAKVPAYAVDKVLSVGSDSITIQTHEKGGVKVTSIDNNGQRTTQRPDNIATYHVTAMTEITVDGIPGKLSDISPGMEVSVTADMSPADAASIVAHTLAPQEDAGKKGKKENEKKATTAGGRAAVTYKEAFRKITGETIIAVTPNRITVGQGGAATATAYLITPLTTVAVNGKPATVATLEKGMTVRVNSGSGNTAASIDASDAAQ